MKRLLFYLLGAALFTALAACGAAELQSTPTPTEPPATNTPIPTPTSTPTPEPVFSYFTNADDVKKLALAPDGSVWSATSGGVVRWDLENNTYTLFHRGNGLPTNDVQSLATTSDGSIWVITRSSGSRYTTYNLLRYKDNEWIEYSEDDGLVNNIPWTLYPTENGLWIGFSGWDENETQEANPGGLAFFDLEAETFTDYTPAGDGFLGHFSGEIYVEPDGRVWVGSTEGINWLEDGEWQSKKIGAKYYDISEQLQGLVENLRARIYSITQAPDGSMWFGTSTGGARYANGVWSYFTSQEGIYLSKELRDIEFDGRGIPWGVHHSGGVYRYEYGRWWWLDQANGLPDIHYIHFIEPDPSGGLWFGTRENGALYTQYPDWIWLQEEDRALSSDELTDILPLEDGSTLIAHPGDGISRIFLDEETLIPYQVDNGVPAQVIYQILPDPDGTLWINANGLFSFDGESWEDYTERNIPALGGALSSFSTMAVAPDSTLWAGFYTGSFGLHRNDNLAAAWDGETWTAYSPDDGLFEGNTIAIDFSPNGNPWLLIDSRFVGSELTGVAWLENDQWKSITSENGFPSAEPRDLAVDGEGIVWVSTEDAALLRYDGSTWQSLTTSDGVPGDNFWELFVDADGNLWAAGDTVLAYHDSSGWTSYAEEDALANTSVHAIAQEQNGAMWFGTSNGAARFDGESWLTITNEDGLPSRSVHAIGCTEDGAVWFASGWNGLTRWGPPQ